jgi:hypothetical protein
VVEGILQGGFVGRREAQVARYQIHLEDLYSADLFCAIYVSSASASVRVGNGCHPMSQNVLRAGHAEFRKCQPHPQAVSHFRRRPPQSSAVGI